jgi:hypothetical protein
LTFRPHIIGAALAISTVAGVALLGAETAPGLAELCQYGYASSHRMPPEDAAALKRKLLKPGQDARLFILDHIVPLCLGGSNAPANLQLQPLREAREKDIEEAVLCRAVCAGNITLDAARQRMREWKPR